MSEEENGPEIFRNVGEVLRYLQDDACRQIRKTKVYEDIKGGLLRKEGRKFRKLDVDRYAASLPLSTTPDGRVQSAEDRQRRKDEAEIRIREAEAYNKEKRNKILDGQYISREQVWQELAGRAVAMNTGLKSAMRAAALDLALTVAGDQGKTDLLIRELEKMIDAASNEYARELRFEVDMGAPEEDENEDTEEGIQCQEGFEHV